MAIRSIFAPADAYRSGAGYVRQPFSSREHLRRGNARPIQIVALQHAKIVLNSLLEAMRRGIIRSYLYELYDEKADPAGKQPDYHYGLFRFDRTPKLAAMAIRSLTRLVATECVGPTSVRSGPPSFRLDDGGAGVRQLIVAELHGSECVILWNTKEFWTWDQFHSHALRPAPVPVHISFPDRAISYQVIDLAVGEKVVGGGHHLSVATLDVPESPIIVVLKKE